MRIEAPSWLLDERAMRPVFAALVSVIAVGAFVTRDDDIISWVFLAPTVAAFWAWAASERAPIWPMTLLGLTTPITLNVIESDSEVSMFISVFTVAAVASFAKARGAVAVIFGTYLMVMVILGITAIGDFAWPNWLAGSLFSWFAGETIWRFINTVDELEHTRSLVADQAVLQERRRIARDVHDLVGHSLSVVMLHITGARHLIHTDPTEAERALEQAEAAGRQSLAEIRRTVGLLRDESGPASPLLPSSDLTDVPGLVEDFVAAGQFVDVSLDGPVGNVDPAIGLAGYRIVQEALTNASRHTLGAQISVTASVDHDRCEIRVENRGGETIDLARGSGFGLVSMRERARSVGGSLLAGPTADGWIVEATLPVEAQETPR